MGPVLTAVAESRTEPLFFPLFQPEGNHILAQARQNERLAPLTLMSDGALIENSFLSAMGDLASVCRTEPDGDHPEQRTGLYPAKPGESAL